METLDADIKARTVADLTGLSVATPNAKMVRTMSTNIEERVEQRDRYALASPFVGTTRSQSRDKLKQGYDYHGRDAENSGGGADCGFSPDVIVKSFFTKDCNGGDSGYRDRVEHRNSNC